MFFITDGEVIGRGCSTKDKIFHVECENHVMGKTDRTSENFCYCSFSLCNKASSGNSLMMMTLSESLVTIPTAFIVILMII